MNMNNAGIRKNDDIKKRTLVLPLTWTSIEQVGLRNPQHQARDKPAHMNCLAISGHITHGTFADYLQDKAWQAYAQNRTENHAQPR